ARSLDGTDIALDRYADQVLLVVNVASECGFTPQYEGLQAVYDEYRHRGFTVLAFPCNQVGQQEPGGPDQIASFCTTQYGVTFPVFAKIDVNGPDAHPLFLWLKSEKAGILGSQRIKSNFTKFLVGRDGRV